MCISDFAQRAGVQEDGRWAFGAGPKMICTTSSSQIRQPTRRPRVGRSAFLTCAPLYWGLARSTALLDIDLVQDTPDRLTGRSLSGDRDVSSISVVEYLRHRDDLVMLLDIAVGSEGPIQSCARGRARSSATTTSTSRRPPSNR
ncbi:MqnA/MqnD/SBP family protein [Streptomyces sp. 900105755]